MKLQKFLPLLFSIYSAKALALPKNILPITQSGKTLIGKVEVEMASKALSKNPEQAFDIVERRVVIPQMDEVRVSKPLYRRKVHHKRKRKGSKSSSLRTKTRSSDLKATPMYRRRRISNKQRKQKQQNKNNLLKATPLYRRSGRKTAKAGQLKATPMYKSDNDDFIEDFNGDLFKSLQVNKAKGSRFRKINRMENRNRNQNQKLRKSTNDFNYYAEDVLLASDDLGLEENIHAGDVYSQNIDVID